MLYLSRKVGESIIINNAIELTVVEVKGKTAKLGFTFPPDVSVLRKELYEKIRSENETAISGGLHEDDILGAFLEIEDEPSQDTEEPKK